MNLLMNGFTAGRTSRQAVTAVLKQVKQEHKKSEHKKN
jgi:hypothetical protein